MATNLQKDIESKLPDDLANVCAMAPAGNDPNGVPYKQRCMECLSADSQKACVATVVADFVESHAPETVETRDVSGDLSNALLQSS